MANIPPALVRSAADPSDLYGPGSRKYELDVWNFIVPSFQEWIVKNEFLFDEISMPNNYSWVRIRSVPINKIRFDLWLDPYNRSGGQAFELFIDIERFAYGFTVKHLDKMITKLIQKIA